MKRNKVSLNIFDKILDVFTWLSFFLAVLLALATIFASFSDQQGGKEIFGVKMFIVKTDSMSTARSISEEDIFFNAGDLIFVKSIDDIHNLKSGDVISFLSLDKESYGQTVTHKIREVKFNSKGELIGYVTYGIRTGANDQTLVQPENVIGIYVGKIQSIGNLFAFLKTPRGYSISILAPSVLLIIFFSVKVGRIIGRREVDREVSKEYLNEFDKLKERVLNIEKSYGDIDTIIAEEMHKKINSGYKS